MFKLPFWFSGFLPRTFAWCRSILRPSRVLSPQVLSTNVLQDPCMYCIFFSCCAFHVWSRNALCSVRLNRRRYVVYTCSMRAVCNLCYSLYVSQPGPYYWLYIVLLGIGPQFCLLGRNLRKPLNTVCTVYWNNLWSTKLCGRYLHMLAICTCLHDLLYLLLVHI